MTRIGVTQIVETVDEYEEHRDCLDQRWGPLLRSLGYVPIPLFNRIEDVEEYVTDLGLDGVVLTGGNDLTTVQDGSNVAPERDSFERALLDVALDRNLPVFGVCRGAQFVNVYFGGSVTKIDGHVATTHEVSVEKPNPEGFESVTTNSYHGYGVTSDDLAGDLQAVGRAPDGTVEWVEHDEQSVSAVMWHPERESPSAEIDRWIIDDSLGNHDS